MDVPASLPYVTGVGGTEFNEGNGVYWNSTNNANNGSARSYIPEMVWNDSSAANGLSAGGGGASSIFGKPSWQTGTGVPADGVRDVPDIAINASNRPMTRTDCCVSRSSPQLVGTHTPQVVSMVSDILTIPSSPSAALRSAVQRFRRNSGLG